MEINATASTVIIKGNIKSISDFTQIKSLIDNTTSQRDSITINIVDSISVTSSVIGYFNKLILKDKINVNMNVGSEQLFNLLDDLNLTSTFKVRRSLS